jgi:hypothetical protein
VHYTKHAYQLNVKAIDYTHLLRRIIRYSCAVSSLPLLNYIYAERLYGVLCSIQSTTGQYRLPREIIRCSFAPVRPFVGSPRSRCELIQRRLALSL